MKTTQLLGLVMILIACEPPEQVNLPQENLRTDLQFQLDEYVIGSPEIPGAWLWIEQGGEEPFGIVSGSNGEDMLSNTEAFRIASISKLFTVVTLMKLVEEGRINIYDLILDYLPGSTLEGLHTPESLAEITIVDLLSHHSGIEDYVALNWISVLQEDPARFWQPSDLIDHVRNHGSPPFTPGTNFYYSDTNYVLLGLLIEVTSGYPLHEAYQEYIFSSLSMDNTFLEAYEPSHGVVMAHGYFEDIDLSDWSTSSDWGGGGLVSTLNDLGRFMRALVEGEIISRQSFHLMQQWVTLNPRSSYGFGIGSYEIGGSRVIGHGGQGFGFTSALYYYPEKDAIICLAVNQQATNIEGFEEAVITTLDRF